MKRSVTKSIILRNLKESDCRKISKAFSIQGWEKKESQYKNYLHLQELGNRDIIVATIEGEFAGYLTINWKSDYIPFQEKRIPEIVDFNVLKKFQRKGIGTILMDEAETRIKNVSAFAGIGFGVTKDYGAAQILYTKRNYIPDGNGLVINSKTVNHGDTVTVDDSICFCMVKEL